MVRGSYISDYSALVYNRMIPEFVPEMTSVTLCRPQIRHTALGRYSLRHTKKDFFYGYESVELGNGQRAFIASPEKALLDLIYLQPGADHPDYIAELRSDLKALDPDVLDRLAAKVNQPKLLRAAQQIRTLAQEEALSYQALSRKTYSS